MMKIPSQPITTSHQSMLEKQRNALEKSGWAIGGSKTKRAQEGGPLLSQPPIHPTGVSSATNKVKKTFNFDMGGLAQKQLISKTD
jgi:hypothetical protein